MTAVSRSPCNEANICSTATPSTIVGPGYLQQEQHHIFVQMALFLGRQAGRSACAVQIIALFYRVWALTPIMYARKKFKDVLGGG